MAKEESTTTKAAPAKATPAKADDAAAVAKDASTTATKAAPDKETKPDREQRVSTCAVNGGRGFHVGDAVNGAVCSYHAMHYDNAGNRR